MNSLVGTKTADNLAKAFAGESQARNRYTFYSKVATKEGYTYIAAVFLETADNERAHAKVFFDHLVQGLGVNQIKVNTEYPVGMGRTVDNLLYAAQGEKEEWGTAYPSFQQIAEQEGFPEVAQSFKEIITIEKEHEQRYLDLLERLQQGTLFKENEPVKWKCANCGYVHEGTDAPAVCPACKHPQGYFFPFCNSY
jgi:rubrerythrin